MNAGVLDILYRVRAGELTVEDAASELESLEAQPIPQVMPASADLPPEEEAFQPDLGWWVHAWLIPLWIGILIFVPSAWLMSWALNNERFFWFYCSWLPLALGLLILVIGAWSRTARWAHIRIQDADGSRVSVSVPLPVKLAGWFLRIFGSRIPGMKDQNFRSTDVLPILEALEHTREPISVEVDDKDGDRVRVYLI